MWDARASYGLRSPGRLCLLGHLEALKLELVRFEVVIFAVGLWMYLVPQPGMVRPAIGTLLFCTGAAWRYHL